MFCVLCQKVKAEAGCYLPGKIVRVCLACYHETVGGFPLPANAANALGGRFADGKKLLESVKTESQKQFGVTMGEFSKAVAAGNAFDNLPGAARREIAEAKQAAQDKAMSGIENIKDKLNTKRDEIENKIQDKIGGAKGKAAKLLGKLF